MAVVDKPIAGARTSPSSSLKRLKAKPSKPASDQLSRAFQVVVYAHESAESLLTAYDDRNKKRGSGAPLTVDQDLLRAMLLMVCAGLDSCAKQVVEHALRDLVGRPGPARDKLETFALRRLRADEETNIGVDAKFLVSLLFGDTERNLIDHLVRDLTGSSLQSKEEMHRVAAALGIGDDEALRTAINQLDSAFTIRNKIVHEMDVNFAAPTRKRTARNRNPMVEKTNLLLNAADVLLTTTDTRLQQLTLRP